MATVPLPDFSDKVEYIFREIHKTNRVRRIITKTGIESVLSHPPKDRFSLTLKELSTINRKLTVPLAEETVLEIARISREFDKMLVGVDSPKKPPQPVRLDEYLQTKNNAQ